MSKSILSSEQLSKLPYRFQVAFALFCAKQVIHLTKSKEAHECIGLVELWLDGKATAEECLQLGNSTYAVVAYSAAAANADAAAAFAAYTAEAADAADAAYADAALYAAHTADYATSHAAYSVQVAGAADHATFAASCAVAYTTHDAAYADIRNAQWAFYKELLSFDTTFEKVVLA